MLSQVPQSRLLTYLLLLGLLPLAFILFELSGERAQLRNLGDVIEDIESATLLHQRRQAINLAVEQQYRDADHFYIDKQLETLTFLAPELKALQAIVDNKNFAGDLKIKQRLDQLSRPSNRLVFTEGVVHSYPLYQETTETLANPVEVNVDDIQNILARVEGVAVGSYTPPPQRPQLIVIDFRFDKKKYEDHNEVYNLNMKLLKREFL